MQAGKLDKLIRIERATATSSPTGQPVKTWVLFAAPWASVVVSGGGESEQMPGRSAKQTAMIELRYIEGVTTQMRVVYLGRLYDIKDVAEPDRRRSLVLTCEAFEVPSGGA